MIEQNTQSTKEKEPQQEKTRQIDTSISTTQDQGAPPQIVAIDKDRKKEDKEEAIQTLVNFPTTGTPTKVL